MRDSEIKKTGIYKGDWNPLAKTEGYTLNLVTTKEGTTYEVVTINLFGESLIIEVNGEKVW